MKKKNKQLTQQERKLLLTLRTVIAGNAVDLADNFSLIELETLQKTAWHGFNLPVHDGIDDHSNIQKMKTVITAAIAEKNFRHNDLKHRRHDRKLVRQLKHQFVEPQLTEADIQAEQQYHEDWYNNLPHVGQIHVQAENIVATSVAEAA